MVEKEAISRITERLSAMENLYFPQSQSQSQSNLLLLTPHDDDAAAASVRKSLLLDLLSRDVAVFLERYGQRLTSEELQEFDILKHDYEINWHLTHLKCLLTPTSDQMRSRSLTIKNRRRAYLDQLIIQGNYFSEDAMRERDPYLHHQYLGNFQHPYGRTMARPGERWSETLMRRAEEAILLKKIRFEQQRLGVHESEWVGNEMTKMQVEEEEEEEEEDEEDEKVNVQDNGVSSSSQVQPQDHTSNGAPSTSAEHIDRPMLSPVEMQEQLDQFTYIMHQKFLSGQDSEHVNYSKIDEDETLDDHWLKEANYDAEEKYFAED